MVGGAAFVGAVVVWWIGWGKGRHGVAVHVAVFHLFHVLAADFDGAFLGYDGDGAFEVLIPDGGGIVEAAHAAVDETEVYKAGIFKLCIVVVVEVVKLGGDVGDVSKEPVHDVHEVAELGVEGTAVHVELTFPVAFAVVTVVAVPIAVDLNHLDLAEHFVLCDGLEPL